MITNKDHLTDEQIQVTQFCGTEPPFSGELLNEKRSGTYLCVVCNESLFDSDTKYESGSGWPSFFDSIENKINRKEDLSHGMKSCLLYTSPSPRDKRQSRMPSSA